MKKLILSLSCLFLAVNALGGTKVQIVSVQALSKNELGFIVKDANGKRSQFKVRTGVIREAVSVDRDEWVTFFPLVQGDTLCMSYKGTKCDRFLGDIDSNGKVSLFPSVFNIPTIETQDGRSYLRWQVSLWLGD